VNTANVTQNTLHRHGMVLNLCVSECGTYRWLETVYYRFRSTTPEPRKSRMPLANCSISPEQD